MPERFRDHGWFVAFAPYDDPQLAIAILGEHGGRGGSTYAPLARKIVEYYFKLSPTPPPQTPAVVQRPPARSPVAATSMVSQPMATP
jgi:hypothetical protein